MKNITLNVIFMLGVMLAFSGAVSATYIPVTGAVEITDVTFDGQDSVIVSPSQSVDVEVTVLATSNGNTPENDWASTKYQIEGESEVCINVPNPNEIFSGTHEHIFMITAPASVGVYDFDVTVYNAENCVNFGDSESVNNAIIVQEQSCGDCVIDIEVPLAGEYYSTINGDLLMDWTATGSNCPSTWNVFYGMWDEELGCDLDSETWGWGFLGTPHVTELWWTIDSFDEGKFCAKVEGACCDADIEGPFYIDNTDPNADANGETCYCGEEWWTPDCDRECDDSCCESDCVEGLYTCFEGDFITLDGSDSSDPGQFPSGIVNYEWTVDGIVVYSGPASTFDYECLDGDRTLLAELVVTDAVGNTGSDTADVQEINVAPVCDGITGPFEVPLINGEAEAMFTGSAHDASDKVDELVPLMFNWNFGDGDSDSGNPSVTHTYTVAGTYDVVLSVEDKDGASSEDCMHSIEVIAPIELDDQEVAAYYPLMADFGDDAGADQGNRGSFLSGLDNIGHTECSVYIGPENLVAASLVDGECTVVWDNDEIAHPGISANPTNDQQGNHVVVIRINNGTDTEYYSFNVMVYSWIIDLNEGWNLISIPYVANDSDIDSAVVGVAQIKNELDSIWSYEYDANGDVSSWKCRKTKADGTWHASFCSGTDTKLETIVPGRGYWLKMDEAAQLKGFGTQIAQTGNSPGMPPEIEVPTNSWSLVGRYGILGSRGNYHYPGETPWDAGGISASTAFESLTMYDNELHVFDIDEDVHLNEVHTVWNNEGYWLWIEDEKFDTVHEGYAPLDKYYQEDLNECGRKNCHLN